MGLFQRFQNLPALEQTSGHVEASLPFSTFERQKNFALTVQVAIPFGIFGIGEVRPGIFVNAFKPFQTFFVAGELIALEHGDERFDVNPPKLLVPFELLTGMAQTIHKVENATVLLVPTIFGLVERDAYSLFNEFGTVQAFAKVHDEPHGLDGMTGVEQAAVEAVNEVAVGVEVLYNQAKIGRAHV